jgi:hypothetical protein
MYTENAYRVEITGCRPLRLHASGLALLVLALTAGAAAEEYAAAPHPVQAAMFLRLLAFDNSHTGDVTIHVVGDSKFAQEMKKGVGKEVGEGKLAKVTSSDSLPSTEPTAVYVSSAKKAEMVTKYTREHDLLSLTGNPELVEKGVTLGLGVSGGKPKVLLNLTSSKEEKIEWNPAILKLAITSK